MKNRVTKRMFRNMVSTTVAAAILGVSLCACGAGPADAAKEEAAPANAAEAESGQEAAPADPAGADSGQKPRRKRQRKAQSPPEKQERRGRYGLCTASIVSVIWKRRGTP